MIVTGKKDEESPLDQTGSEPPSVEPVGSGADAAATNQRAGAEAADDGVEPEEAWQEFADYDSLEDDDDAQPPLTFSAVADEPGDAPLATPKERRLATMRLEARVEAVVFASQKPLKPSEIVDILGDTTISEEDVQVTLDQLVAFYHERCGGFRLHYLKRLGYQFQTADAAGAIMERMFASRPRPISRAALETLAIIAYRQPVTRAEVEFIRGVDAGSIFKTLLERELIKCVGRKEIVGRPMLFGTRDEFLKVFNLSSIKDLPPLESFQPSREVTQGAAERLEAGDDLVDVEEYIADNTVGEYEGDDDEGLGADNHTVPPNAMTPIEDPTETPPIPDSAAGVDDFGSQASLDDQDSDDNEWAAEAAATSSHAGSGLANPAVDTADMSSDSEGVDGTDQDSEVVVPAGNSIPPGSRDLD